MQLRDINIFTENILQLFLHLIKMSVICKIPKQKGDKVNFLRIHVSIRTLWSCGLICHVLDWKVEGSNLAAAKNLFQFKST